MKGQLFLIFIIFFFIIILSFGSFYKTYETFRTPEVSSTVDVGAGASEYYGWGYSPIEHKRRRRKPREKICPKCDEIYIDNHICNIVIDDRERCRYCDITLNKDIDKYVLKSSVPPCPDMSQFATKSMLTPQPDMSKYILKSRLPEVCASYWPGDLYMLKSKCVPRACPKCKTLNEYNIEEHKDFHKYISKENCKKYKRSWIQNFEEWWESIFGGGGAEAKFGLSIGGQRRAGSGFPLGYGFTPYAGYGTQNPGYALDGSRVKHRSIVNGGAPAK